MRYAASYQTYSIWYRSPKIEINYKLQELACSFLETVRHIPVLNRSSLACGSYHPFVPVTIETGSESRVVTMATGISDAGTAYKVLAQGKFQEKGRLKLTLIDSKVVLLTDNYGINDSENLES
jgi:hypothetical protein